ncbi:hypothetical protein BRC71_10010 [Halobacteriales archaeon QH_7_65_31]|nr:MAG: hypothetical protein BRC71_10010 [Halobacteriales archaeon QH_7_65_31]
MQLSSLPDRPFELAELRELNESGRFRAVFPAGVFDFDGSDAKLVPAAVLVTPGDGSEGESSDGHESEGGNVVAVGYDFEAGWQRISSEPAGDQVQEQVELAATELRAWAAETDQRWAMSDGATALAEHVGALDE